MTAYISWALVHAGYLDDPATQRGLTYIREHDNEVEDPYALALVPLRWPPRSAGRLQPAGPDRLAAKAVTEANTAYWQSDEPPMMGSEGKTVP